MSTLRKHINLTGKILALSLITELDPASATADEKPAVRAAIAWARRQLRRLGITSSGILSVEQSAQLATAVLTDQDLDINPPDEGPQS